jgi:hypothetical protein
LSRIDIEHFAVGLEGLVHLAVLFKRGSLDNMRERFGLAPAFRPQHQILRRRGIERIVLLLDLFWTGGREGLSSRRLGRRRSRGGDIEEKKQKSTEQKRVPVRRSPLLLCHVRDCNFGARSSQTSCSPAQEKTSLCFVAQTLLMAILPHALTALMLGDFRFASFLERTHTTRLHAIQALALRNRNRFLSEDRGGNNQCSNKTRTPIMPSSIAMIALSYFSNADQFVGIAAGKMRQRKPLIVDRCRDRLAH